MPRGHSNLDLLLPPFVSLYVPQRTCTRPPKRNCCGTLRKFIYSSNLRMWNTGFVAVASSYSGRGNSELFRKLDRLTISVVSCILHSFTVPLQLAVSGADRQEQLAFSLTCSAFPNVPPVSIERSFVWSSEGALASWPIPRSTGIKACLVGSTLKFVSSALTLASNQAKWRSTADFS